MAKICAIMTNVFSAGAGFPSHVMTLVFKKVYWLSGTPGYRMLTLVTNGLLQISGPRFYIKTLSDG